MPNQCGECAHYYAESAEHREIGECRRYAPRPRLVKMPENHIETRYTPHLEVFWPVVLDEDWCGEFQQDTVDRLRDADFKGNILGH